MRPAPRENGDSASWLDWWRERGERELRCILMTAWDPIGVGDAAQAWDEYESYAPHVASILRDTEDPQEAADRIGQYLTNVERNLMGIQSDQSRPLNARLAASLVGWHEWSYRQGG